MYELANVLKALLDLVRITIAKYLIKLFIFIAPQGMMQTLIDNIKKEIWKEAANEFDNGN